MATAIDYLKDDLKRDFKQWKQSAEADEIEFSSAQEALEILRQCVGQIKDAYDEVLKYLDLATINQRLEMDPQMHCHCSRLSDHATDLMLVAAKTSLLAAKVSETQPKSRRF